ncbi:MAG: C4-dicarboxylate ABC transporter [Gemmatimonadetes bacterium]|nr:C4-dicarboxylate ABC transporter [Gemmatimonadota bacterium]
MDLAWITLIALGIVVLASCTTKLNPGVLAIVLAWVVGVYMAEPGGEPLGLRTVVSGFPTDLFLTLTGVTFLFALAQGNGTLERVAAVAVKLCRGNAGLIPLAFFALTFVFASVGAGNIAATALIAPTAMATAHRARISSFLMMIMVGHGAVAGAMSPVAPTGVIAAGIMRDRIGVEGFEWQFYLDNLMANVVIAMVGYLLFGGWKLFRAHSTESSRAEVSPLGEGAFALKHKVTLGVLAGLLVSVIGFDANVGMAAFAGGGILVLGGFSDESDAIKRMPWGVILMVSGVTVLTALLDETGGSELFTNLVAEISGPRSVTGVIAFITGIISVYSSTSGVVLPAFLPIAAGLADQVGASVMAVASSIIVGGHLVDTSPLSTIGALAIASADTSEDRRALFNKGLAWGLSMAVVGAIFCLLYFGLR